MKCSYCHCDMDLGKLGYRYIEVKIKEVNTGEYCYIQEVNDQGVVCSKECFEEYMGGRGFGW